MALGVTVAELEARMTAREFMEWAAFERVYGPLTAQERVDVGMAQLSAIMANLWSNKGGHKLRDFMPSWFRPPEDQDSVRAGFLALLRLAEHGNDS